MRARDRKGELKRERESILIPVMDVAGWGQLAAAGWPRLQSQEWTVPSPKSALHTHATHASKW